MSCRIHFIFIVDSCFLDLHRMGSKANNNEISIEVFPPILQQNRADNHSNFQLIKKTSGIIYNKKPWSRMTGSFKTQHFLDRPLNETNYSGFTGTKMFSSNFISSKRKNLWQAHRRRNKDILNECKSNTQVSKDRQQNKQLYKVSFPCAFGCAKCSFTNCLGPVRVYVSQFKEPPKSFVNEIHDGQGRRVIPRHRRKELRGLVYDKESHSLHPPLPKSLTGNSKFQKIFY